MSKNIYRTPETDQLGSQAEIGFKAAADNAGWHVVNANAHQDRIGHWDCLISAYNQTYRVEIKSMKKISRSDSHPQDKFLWIELVGIDGFNGWLYGDSDLIAFELYERFILIKRADLVAFIESAVNEVFVNDPYHAVYQHYGRANRMDVVTLVPTIDVLDIVHLAFDKVSA